VSDQYLGEIRIFGFNFAPTGWALCNGQLMSIQQNSALFALLGTFYGGNGTQTFALPDLQGRMPLHTGVNYPQGMYSGEQNHTLTIQELPQHTHQAVATASDATTPSGSGNTWARNNANPYVAAPPPSAVTMAAGALTPAGQSQPHNNLHPYLTVTFCIALVGIFPSRN
jgi:microcystin-dependent protein